MREHPSHSRPVTARGDCKGHAGPPRLGRRGCARRGHDTGVAPTVAKGPTKSRSQPATAKTCKTRPSKPAKAAAPTRTFKELVAPYPREVQALAKATRTFMLELLPKVKETIDPTGPYIQYSYGPGYKGVVSYITVNQKGVKLGVARGLASRSKGPASGNRERQSSRRDRHAIRSPDARPASTRARGSGGVEKGACLTRANRRSDRRRPRRLCEQLSPLSHGARARRQSTPRRSRPFDCSPARSVWASSPPRRDAPVLVCKARGCPPLFFSSMPFRFRTRTDF